MRSAWMLCGLLVAAAWALIACAGELPDPVPDQLATTTPVASAPQPNGIATASAQPSPTATLQLTLTAAVATTPAPAANTPTRPAPTPTHESQPAALALPSETPTRFLIRLRDDLDDPLGYCIDVRGFGSGIRLDADLQAHSCKSTSADDQAFASIGEPADGSIVLVDYDICLAVAEPEPGASIVLGQCDDSSVFQRFEWLPDGRLRLIAEPSASDPTLCLGVAGGSGEPAGGRNHLRRDLMLRDCAATDLALIAWNAATNQ